MAPHHRLLKALRFIGQHELGTLIGVLGVLLAVLAFLELGEVARIPEATRFDRSLLLAMRTPGHVGDPIGPEWLEGMMRDMTSFGGPIVQALVTLAVIGFLLLERKTRAAVFVVIAVLGGMLLALLLKDVFERPRPEIISREIEIASASFPSGHSMMSAVTYLTLGALLARTHRSRLVRAYFLLLAIFLAFVVGLTRMYLGVHWPTDVVAGWTAGAAWALVCWLVALRLQRGRVVEAPAGDVPAPA